MADVLERIHRFEREIEMAGSRTVESPFGVGVLDPSLPLRHDSNYFLVERLPLGAGAQELADEAERILGGAGLAHRSVVTFDAGSARSSSRSSRSSAGTSAATSGWRGSASRIAARLSVVQEVGEADLRPGRTTEIRLSLGHRGGRAPVARREAAARPARRRGSSACPWTARSSAGRTSTSPRASARSRTSPRRRRTAARATRAPSSSERPRKPARRAPTCLPRRRRGRLAASTAGLRDTLHFHLRPAQGHCYWCRGRPPAALVESHRRASSARSMR